MANRVHCLVLSYPAQGHINPMLQFSKLLEHEGVKTTLAIPLFYRKNLQKVPSSIAIETISDGFDDGRHGEAEHQRVYLDRFWKVGPQTLGELIEKLARSGNPVNCLIYNSFMPWGLEVAKKFGIVGACFLTQNMAVNSIYYHVHLGNLQAPLKKHEISLPALPILQLEDMPSFFFTYEKDPSFLEFLVGQFSNIDKADWVFCNTFYELEKEVVDWITNIWPKFRTIGPTIPSMFLDKRLEHDDDYDVAQFSSEDCMEWLGNKPKESVVYVSFGSIATLCEEQMEELAIALKDSGNYFLWVIRDSEDSKLPKDFEKKTERGLVVTWCSQLKVLAHEAVGCFVTQCGWNSTLEALSIGVPTIGVPYWSDQSTDAKYITDIWKIGIRAPPVDENKIVKREVFMHCIKEMMKSEKGKDMKRNAMQWKTLAARAIDEGGSSHKNIIEFVNGLFHLRAAHPELQFTS